MNIIGKKQLTDDSFEFFCQSPDGWYYSMMVKNIFGAIDMACRIPTMDTETFKRIAGDRLR